MAKQSKRRSNEELYNMSAKAGMNPPSFKERLKAKGFDTDAMRKNADDWAAWEAKSGRNWGPSGYPATPAATPSNGVVYGAAAPKSNPVRPSAPAVPANPSVPATPSAPAVSEAPVYMPNGANIADDSNTYTGQNPYVETRANAGILPTPSAIRFFDPSRRDAAVKAFVGGNAVANGGATGLNSVPWNYNVANTDGAPTESERLANRDAAVQAYLLGGNAANVSANAGVAPSYAFPDNVAALYDVIDNPNASVEAKEEASRQLALMRLMSR